MLEQPPTRLTKTHGCIRVTISVKVPPSRRNIYIKVEAVQVQAGNILFNLVVLKSCPDYYDYDVLDTFLV